MLRQLSYATQEDLRLLMGIDQYAFAVHASMGSTMQVPRGGASADGGEDEAYQLRVRSEEPVLIYHLHGYDEADGAAPSAVAARARKAASLPAVDALGSTMGKAPGKRRRTERSVKVRGRRGSALSPQQPGADACPPQVSSEKLEPLEEDNHFPYAMEGDDTVADLFADSLQ